MITERAEGYAQPPRFPRTNGLQLLSNLEEFNFHCKPHPLRVRHTDRSVARGVWRLRACGVWRALRACVVCGGPLWVSLAYRNIRDGAHTRQLVQDTIGRVEFACDYEWCCG
jgi:hypothetical protein